MTACDLSCDLPRSGIIDMESFDMRCNGKWRRILWLWTVGEQIGDGKWNLNHLVLHEDSKRSYKHFRQQFKKSSDLGGNWEFVTHFNDYLFLHIY